MNVPKLRFIEFTDEWKLVRLGDCCKLITKGTTPNRFTNEGIKFVKIESLNNYQVDNNKCLHIAENIHTTSLKRSILEDEDVLFAIAGATVGKCGIVKKKNLPANTNQALSILRVNPKILNPYYLLNILDSKYMRKYIFLNISVGAQPNLNLEQVNNFKFKLPSKGEQNKIVKTFNLINKKIELQTKKIEALKLFKKGLIIHTKNVTTQWSTIKIGDIFKSTRGVVISKSNISPKKENNFLYPVYSSQTSNNGILGYDTTYDFNGKYLTWTTDGANAGKVFYRKGKFRCTNVCGILFNNNNMYINELMAELLNLETPKYVSYVGNPKLMNNIMESITMKIPPLKEQIFISNFLKVVNKKIELEISIFYHLKHLKKGLLQNMFV